MAYGQVDPDLAVRGHSEVRVECDPASARVRLVLAGEQLCPRFVDEAEVIAEIP